MFDMESFRYLINAYKIQIYDFRLVPKMITILQIKNKQRTQTKFQLSQSIIFNKEAPLKTISYNSPYSDHINIFSMCQDIYIYNSIFRYLTLNSKNTIPTSYSLYAFLQFL